MKPTQRKVLFAALALAALADFGVTQSPITPFNPMPLEELRSKGPASPDPTDVEAARALMTLGQLPTDATGPAIQWLVRGTPRARRLLAEAMYATTESKLLVQMLDALRSLAARDLQAEACDLAPYVAPFVHFPVPVVNDAARQCLRRLADEAAVTMALANADPWPAWFPLQDGGSKQAQFEYLEDNGRPAVMRAILLGKQLTQDLVAAYEAQQRTLRWLLGDEAILCRTALRALDITSRPGPGANMAYPGSQEQDLSVALAGVPKSTRTAIRAMLRNRLAVDWPTSLAEDLLASTELPFLNAEAQVQMQKLARLRAPGMLRRFFARDPVATAALLQQAPEPPPPDLVPILAAQLDEFPTSKAHYELLARSEAGRTALRERARTERRETALWCAISPQPSGPRVMAPFAEALLEQWRKGSQVTDSHVSHLHSYLRELPWQETGNDLYRLQSVIRKLWEQADDTRRRLYLPLLSACGRDASFAATDLFKMWVQSSSNQSPSNRTDIAEALLAAGQREFVLGKLDHFGLGALDQRDPNREKSKRLHALRLERDLIRCVNSASDEFLVRLGRLPVASPSRDGRKYWGMKYRGLLPAQRSAIAKRLLLELEETKNPEITRYLEELGGEFGGEFDASIDDAMTAFYERRRTFDQGVDPLAEAVAQATAYCLPDLLAKGMRRGVVPPRVLKNLRKAPTTARARWLAAVPDLVSVAGANPHAGFGTLLGSLWAAVGIDPSEALLPLLAEPRTVSFALHALTQLRDLPPEAIDVLAPLLDTADQGQRDLVLDLLLCQGERGLALVSNPELVPAATVGARAMFLLRQDLRRASALLHCLALHPEFLPTIETLGSSYTTDTCADWQVHRDRLLCLTARHLQASDRDWLWLATVAEAELRRQFVDSVPKQRTLSPIACGVLVELLDDEDSGVRAAACNQLLAVRERAILCRRPLSEYAAKTPEVAARVREVLDSER